MSNMHYYVIIKKILNIFKPLNGKKLTWQLFLHFFLLFFVTNHNIFVLLMVKGFLSHSLK